MDGKCCTKCGVWKTLDDFYTYKNGKGGIVFRNECKSCANKRSAAWYENNTEHAKQMRMTRYEANKEQENEEAKQWRENNKERKKQTDKAWRENNKERAARTEKEWHKNNSDKRNQKRRERWKNDPAWRLAKIQSTQINRAIKAQGSSKGGRSSRGTLPYTVQEFKRHIEEQFEPWMNWDNHGKYDPKTWDDNDSSTWTWQIDHIIPRSRLPYKDMDDPNFLRCEGLSNLRPYSAKLNIKEGDRR